MCIEPASSTSGCQNIMTIFFSSDWGYRDLWHPSRSHLAIYRVTTLLPGIEFFTHWWCFFVICCLWKDFYSCLITEHNWWLLSWWFFEIRTLLFFLFLFWKEMLKNVVVHWVLQSGISVWYHMVVKCQVLHFLLRCLYDQVLNNIMELNS